MRTGVVRAGPECVTVISAGMSAYLGGRAIEAFDVVDGLRPLRGQASVLHFSIWCRGERVGAVAGSAVGHRHTHAFPNCVGNLCACSQNPAAVSSFIPEVSGLGSIPCPAVKQECRGTIRSQVDLWRDGFSNTIWSIVISK